MLPGCPSRPHRMRRLLPLLLLAVACGRSAAREDRATRETHRVTVAPARYDSTVYVRQAGAVVSTISTVMQLRVGARDAQVTIEDEGGRQAVVGAPGGDRLEEIPGSRVVSLTDDPADSLRAPWRASASIPVLEGERYLVELYPSSRRIDSISVDLSADDQPLASERVAADVTDGLPALFEVAVGSHTASVSRQIGRIEVVPACGTTHVVRSASLVELYARWEVAGTGESGDLHVLPRPADARFRGLSFQTRTPGDVAITYRGRELARAARPEACGGNQEVGSRE